MRETTDAQQMKIILNAIEQDRKDRRSMRRLIIICATICLICVMAIGGLFIAFASGLEITTTTENTSVTQDTGVGDGNNVYQAGEYAEYTEGSGS